jgi:uncharacterized protein YndB with AHSA1/START domain
MDGYVLSVERVIPAPPEKIFDLVADAAKHPLIDGSGSVKQVKEGAPERLSKGATFGMNMQLGMKYSMVSEVIEFDENRRIAWQSKPRGVGGRLAGGRIWRYELEPVDGGTLVRESWDLSQDKQRALLKRGPMPRQTKGNMEKTLERIEEIVTKQ